jgi:uncharacterized protein (DUF1330 family)
MQKGYIYAEVEITDPAVYEKYRPLAAASTKAFGGRHIVLQGDPKVLEGDRDVRRVLLIEFESRERAMEWYNSEQYQEAKAVRVRGSVTHLTLLSGNDGS